MDDVQDSSCLTVEEIRRRAEGMRSITGHESFSSDCGEFGLALFIYKIRKCWKTRSR